MLDGKEINTLPPNKRDMSMVFQSYAIFPHLNIFENIAYGLNVQRLPKAEIVNGGWAGDGPGGADRL